ncbi:ABC transporter ATP-binding protein [Candidatus Enterococcus huntleyi]|uniref:ABC transporter ATP-binding protein n=1 Tax=Candidatus Enterococcus huntleyi TaxID=1857217 RepID=UPI00137A3D38|nr:ABC transporter ATP-binding protein [Enterococcus sp. JM4C]
MTNVLLADRIEFDLHKGRIYGLSAPNGSGKSTLLRTIAGVRNEKIGHAKLIEKDQKLSAKEVKKLIYYFESSTWFNPALSGWDYLQLVCGLWKSDKKYIKEAIDYWQMDSFIHTPIKKYSLGMKQKVLLSLYMVANADYWLLDEPTIGLDRASIKRFEELLAIKKAEGKAILFSAHESEEFFSICDQQFRLELGIFKLLDAEVSA